MAGRDDGPGKGRAPEGLKDTAADADPTEIIDPFGTQDILPSDRTVVGARPSDAVLAEMLVRQSPNGVMVTDVRGRVRMVNPALGRMVPLVPDPRGRMPIEVCPIERMADALSPDRHDDVEFTIKVGNRDLLIRTVSLEIAGHGRLALVEDVTSLRRAERYRSEFVANVSHELRTPATAIAGYAETLLDEEGLDPMVKDMVEVIYRNAQRLTSIFEDLLILSRIEQRQGPLPMQNVSLLGVAKEGVDKMRVLAEERGIEFQVFVEADQHAWANRDALSHVVGNLVSNAVKYSYEGGIVTVRASVRTAGVLLEVIDVGVGISTEDQMHIFERFYRVDKGRSRDTGGTGLGLAIVQRMVRALGGGMEVRSQPGSGSVFRVLLQPGRS